MSITLATLDDTRAMAQVHVVSWQHAYRERLSTEFRAALSVGERESMRCERIVQGSPGERAHAGLRLSQAAGVKGQS